MIEQVRFHQDSLRVFVLKKTPCVCRSRDQFIHDLKRYLSRSVWFTELWITGNLANIPTNVFLENDLNQN